MSSLSHPEKPIERVLNRLDSFEQRNGYYMALCRAHDDNNPSLGLREGRDGKVLVKCFAGCTFKEIAASLSLEEADFFPDDSAMRGGGVRPPSDNPRTVEPQGCTLDAYARAKGLPVEVLKGLAVSEIPNYNGAPAVRFGYLNEEGEEICVRFRVSLDRKPTIKTRRGDKAALYGLWRLEEARDKDYVVAVEGESDAQTLWLRGFPAIGMPGASTWKSDWSEHLEGIKRIYVVVEPDAGGEGLWERMAASPLREKLYRVQLDGFKDASEMHLDSPEQFSDRLGVALASATNYMDIAETEAQERGREAWTRCEDLANEPYILDRFAVDYNKCGVAGEARAGKLVYLALNSRHLDAKQLGNVVVKGPSSAGKTYTVEKATDFFPEDAYHFLTAMSERALAYSEEPLSHRFLILAEAAGMSGEFQIYLIRSLLSEGRLRYETVEKTSEGLKPKIIEREGPTGLIVTTTRTRLHSENETRMLTVRVDDTPDHTSKILAALADEEAEVPDLGEWHALQTWIGAGERRVTIPYAKTLAKQVPPLAVRLRRDFGAVLSLIRSHALLHRASRQRDQRGRIVADLEDYAVVRELVADLISEGVEASVPVVVRETVVVVDRLNEDADGPVTGAQVGRELKLDKSATDRRLKMAEDAGYIKNLEEHKGRPARWVLGDPMPEDEEILPTPEKLAESSTILRF
jgi:hypothetical protein